MSRWLAMVKTWRAKRRYNAEMSKEHVWVEVPGYGSRPRPISHRRK